MSDIFRSDEWSKWMIRGSVCMIDVFITWSKLDHLRSTYTIP